MNFEIFWNDEVYYVPNMGNPWQACLYVLDTFIKTYPEENIPISSFNVFNLSDGYNTESHIGLSEILSIKILAVNDELIELCENSI